MSSLEITGGTIYLIFCKSRKDTDDHLFIVHKHLHVFVRKWLACKVTELQSQALSAF